MEIRNYNPETDYPGLRELYENSETYGGIFDEARDSKERVDALETAKPGSVLVAIASDEIVGSATLFEDNRAAWLYRFAVLRSHEVEVISPLYRKAKENMKQRGHSQIIVYAPAGDKFFVERYTDLGFTHGQNYAAYWSNI